MLQMPNGGAGTFVQIPTVPKTNVRPTIQSQNYKVDHKKWILITAAKVFEEKCTFRKNQN